MTIFKASGPLDKTQKIISISIGSVLVVTTAISLPFIITEILKTTAAITRPDEFVPPDVTEGFEAFGPRSKNWYQVDYDLDIGNNSRYAFRFIDGSTATIPITAEIIRQQETYAETLPYYNIDLTTEKGRYDYDMGLNRDIYEDFHYKTHTAYQHLIAADCLLHGNITHSHPNGNYWGPGTRMGRADLIFVTQPSDDELSYAHELGVTLDIRAVCNEAFVFIVSEDNPIESLTIQQIQDIYQGKVTNWSEVGGDDREIVPFQRNANSGSQTTMEKDVMKGKEMIEPTTTKGVYTEIQSMGGIIERIVDMAEEFKDEASSIGYTYNYYIKNIYSDRPVKVINVEGIEANKDTVGDNSYPFVTSYYTVMRGEHPLDENYNADAVKLRDFLLTSLGQEYIELAGYYPL